MEIVKTNSVQKHSYQITINNPLDKEFSHEQIRKTLVERFPTLRYFAMADEIGEQGTPHTHLLVIFSSRVRFSTIKKNFPSAHIEATNGSVKDNIAYIKKDGKWLNTDKCHTSVKGTYEEWGTPPKNQGRKAEFEQIVDLIQQGYTNAEMLIINNDYFPFVDKIDRVRTMLLTERFKNDIRLDMQVTYIFGETGAGKTRGILETHGTSNIYRICDYEHPFDGYSCQPVLVMDEFRSQLKISNLLQYLDIYPIELPARYSNKFACYSSVYLISNWDLKKQYWMNQAEDKETWNAFLRRIHSVKEYRKNPDGGKPIIIDHGTATNYIYPPTPDWVTDAENCTQMEVKYG